MINNRVGGLFCAVVAVVWREKCSTPTDVLRQKERLTYIKRYMCSLCPTGAKTLYLTRNWKVFDNGSFIGAPKKCIAALERIFCFPFSFSFLFSCWWFVLVILQTITAAQTQWRRNYRSTTRIKRSRPHLWIVPTNKMNWSTWCSQQYTVYTFMSRSIQGGLSVASEIPTSWPHHANT